MKDYYEILGVPKSASKEAIKQAYRKLAHTYHPDKGGDEKKFKEINEAYQVLGDEQKKARYDQFGPAFGSHGQGGFSGFQGFDFGNFDFSGFQGEQGSRNFDFNDIFSEFFGGRARTATRTKRATGQDIQVDLLITLEEAFQGVAKTVSLKKYAICDQCNGKKNDPGSSFKTCGICNGTGEIRRNVRILFGTFTQVSSCTSCNGEGNVPEKKCFGCHGSGRIHQIEDIAIHIPSGVSSGQMVKISGKGEAGDDGYGDLYAAIRIKKHAFLNREGDNIFSQVQVSISQAVLGDTIQVKTLSGEEKVSIPIGIESGEMIKLEGKGMPRLHGYGRGDQYVRIIVKTPKRLSKRAKELFEELKREGV